MSDEIRFRSDISVKLVQHVGSDLMVCRAARVSVVGAEADETPEALGGLIRYLLRNKHSSPLEHGSLTFLVEAPIFVFREWMRHRTWSFNETSGRYRVLEPEFWVPPEGRPVREPEAFKPSRPMLLADEALRRSVTGVMWHSMTSAWWCYKAMIADGVAREVARSVLPVSTYSQMYATVNPRNLLGFLSLRTHEPGAAHVSYPQAEIESGARQMEKVFAELFPLTYAAWVEFGRAAP